MLHPYITASDRHLDIIFGLQVVESSSLVFVLFREAFNHPFIFFQLLVIGFSVMYVCMYINIVLIYINIVYDNG